MKANTLALADSTFAIAIDQQLFAKRLLFGDGNIHDVFHHARLTDLLQCRLQNGGRRKRIVQSTMMIKIRKPKRFREFVQTIARLPRENSTRKLYRTKSRRVELDAAALQLGRHELAVELNVVRNENAILQKSGHMFCNCAKLRLSTYHFIGDAREFSDKRRYRLSRIYKRVVRFNNFGTVHQGDSDFHYSIIFTMSAGRFEIDYRKF